MIGDDVTLYQSVTHESVDDPGQSAGRKHDAPGQLGHIQLSLGDAGQSQQHVIVAQGELVFGAQLCVELVGHLLVRVQKGLPGRQFSLAEFAAHGRPR